MQDNRESINKKNAPEGKSAENRKLFFWRIAASVLFLAVIALGLLLFPGEHTGMSAGYVFDEAQETDGKLNISFSVNGGEILGIAGIAGSGQRELLEAIAGLQ